MLDAGANRRSNWRFAMLSGISGLLAVATLLVNQAVFKDPGPPPTEARAVPTLEQAKSFVETMAGRHGSYSCSTQYGNISATIKVNLADNNLTIRTHHVQDMTEDGEAPSIAETLWVNNLSVSDVEFATVEQVAVRDSCHPAYLIKIHCKDGNCTNTTIDRKNIIVGKTENDSRSLQQPGAGFAVQQKEMAERIVKALNFYKEQIKAVTPESPF